MRCERGVDGIGIGRGDGYTRSPRRGCLARGSVVALAQQTGNFSWNDMHFDLHVSPPTTQGRSMTPMLRSLVPLP